MFAKLFPFLTVIAILGGLISHHSNGEHSLDFEEWKRIHGIHYSRAENSYREAVFRSNVEKIEKHNSDPYRTYDMGLNHFSALTQEEFESTYLTLRTNAKPLTPEQMEDTYLGDIDWVAVGAVTPIKDQGQCGSCWAFSTTGALEALSKVGYGTLLSFSEQQLVDCSTSYGNHGCDGGLMNNAFKYVKERGSV